MGGTGICTQEHKVSENKKKWVLEIFYVASIWQFILLICTRDVDLMLNVIYSISTINYTTKTFAGYIQWCIVHTSGSALGNYSWLASMTIWSAEDWTWGGSVQGKYAVFISLAPTLQKLKKKPTSNRSRLVGGRHWWMDVSTGWRIGVEILYTQNLSMNTFVNSQWIHFFKKN